MTDEETKTIEEACEKATPGPWRADEMKDMNYDVPLFDIMTDSGSSPGPRIYPVAVHVEPNDAPFIAGSRSWVPALLAEVGRLKEKIKMEVFVSVPPKMEIEHEREACATIGFSEYERLLAESDSDCCAEACRGVALQIVCRGMSEEARGRAKENGFKLGATEQAIEVAKLAEREACAKEAESWGDQNIADKIRERSIHP